MISATIDGTLPKINPDLTEAMVNVKTIMLESVLKGFGTSGYGKWAATREGRVATLMGLKPTVQSDSGLDWAEVRAKNTIHQRGGMYQASDKQRRYLFATHPEWRKSSGKTGQGMILKFPPRPYLTLQESDFEAMRKELIDRAFTIEEIQEGAK